MAQDIDPGTLNLADRYKLLIGAVVPRPIALVSTIDRAGRPNLAPFSFFNGVGSDPMTLLFCPANKADGSEKDTLRNVALPPDGIGEFVVNIVSDRFAHRMSACAEELPYGDSEFSLAGLEQAPSSVVRPPRVAESPFAFECRTIQVIRLNPGRPAGGNIVIGEVVWVHAADGVVNERFHVDPDMLDAVGRMGGHGYTRTRDRFDLPPGRAALNSRPD